MEEKLQDHEDVRLKESLKVKIGEAKNLAGISSVNGNKSTCCVLKLDGEVIYRTAQVEKSSNPYYGEEFKGEIPRSFQFMSFNVLEAGHKNEKILGKVTLRKQDLHKCCGKDHWLPLLPSTSNCDMQGKVHTEMRFDEVVDVGSSNSITRLSVRLIECSDLAVTNGACNPYAVVSVLYGANKEKEDVKKTTIQKKTICPQFEQTFCFYLEQRRLQQRNQYIFQNAFDVADLSISLWHDDTRVVSERLGHKFRGTFLGEVTIPISDLETSVMHNAWYFLQGRDGHFSNDRPVGSLRVNISYTSDLIFLSHYYDELRALMLHSPLVQPISSSAVCILGDIVDNLPEAALPVTRVFLHDGKLVSLIEALAEKEILSTSDSNTLFRGNTVVSKIVDELMKHVGMPYLHATIKPIIEQICKEDLVCEIDTKKLKDCENSDENLTSLFGYIDKTLNSIVDSALSCPTVMTEVFDALKCCAVRHFPENVEVRYQMISGFIFLRFFAPAILGPKMFELHSDTLNARVQRSLTLLSKAIQGLGNLVSAKKQSLAIKEEYMIPIFQKFTDSERVASIKMYLDIISTKRHINVRSIESPIVLKEGSLIKRGQSRRCCKWTTFKRRYFCLTNHSLSYSHSKGSKCLSELSLADIVAVEKVREESFDMKYIFQIVFQSADVLYLQARNCIEENEWLDILTKICNSNKKRNTFYHPAAFINGQWLCCKVTESSAVGCSPVTHGLEVSDMCISHIDSDREIQRIHSLFLQHRDRLEVLQDECADQEVYSGTVNLGQRPIEDTKSCFKTVNEILECVIRLEQEHEQYEKLVASRRAIGSQENPVSEGNMKHFHALSAKQGTGSKSESDYGSTNL